MYTFALYAQTENSKKEIISRVLAKTIDDAILVFCEQKKLNKKQLLEIFKVEKIKKV